MFDAARLALIVALVAGAGAQAGIKLNKVPDEVVLPARDGTNLLLEVTIPGKVADVRLVGERQTQRGPALRATGDGTFQINLNDPEVIAMVTRTGDRFGQFQVAADVGGKPLLSEPVAWTRAFFTDTPIRCLIRLTNVVEPAVAASGTTTWLEPDRIDRIEIADVTRPALAFVAHLGSTSLPLVADRERAKWTVALDAERRAAWQQAGVLEIEQRDGEDVTVPFTLAAVPDRLELPAGKAQITVRQRQAQPVPGSRDGVRVEIDDITGGQTAMRVIARNGRVLAGPRSRRQGERLEFRLGTTDYAIVVAKLNNLLIGEDFADLEVVPVATLAPDPIARLLERIEQGAIRFIREGKEYPGNEAAAHLRQKLAALKQAPTLAQFIDEVASKSSVTGNDYRVRLADGKELSARDWLRQQAATIDGGGATK
ncbi:MAG: DUF5329 family protein [Planctomycetes bacterium]|nr:DUF5329 family protein [Planctomycetota bacterium]